MANTPSPSKNATQSWAPTNKTVAATGGSAIGAAVATLVIFGIDPSHTLPDTVVAAITTLVTAVVTLSAAWFTPPGSNETVIQTIDGAKSARLQS